MSIFMVAQVSQLAFYFRSQVRNLRHNSFYDLERGALAVTRSGTIQQRSNGLNGLAVAANHSANIALAQLHLEHGHFSAWNLSEHYVVWKFNELPNHEFEKFLHVNLNRRGPP
jgi:hypothetical protein